MRFGQGGIDNLEPALVIQHRDALWKAVDHVLQQLPAVPQFLLVARPFGDVLAPHDYPGNLTVGVQQREHHQATDGRQAVQTWHGKLRKLRGPARRDHLLDQVRALGEHVGHLRRKRGLACPDARVGVRPGME